MSKSDQPSTHILMLLGEGFDDMEAVTAIDACGWSQYRDGIADIELDITGFRHKTTGRFGTCLVSTISLDEISPDQFDAVVIPGGFRSHGFNEMYDQKIYDLITAIYQHGGSIATMCVGILPVAEAGLLKGKAATTYPYSRHDNFEQLQQCGALISKNKLVEDERIISCAGPAQSLAVMMSLFDLLIGSVATSEIRIFMCLDKDF